MRVNNEPEGDASETATHVHCWRCGGKFMRKRGECNQCGAEIDESRNHWEYVESLQADARRLDWLVDTGNQASGSGSMWSIIGNRQGYRTQLSRGTTAREAIDAAMEP